jgi:hypothetical protein
MSEKEAKEIEDFLNKAREKLNKEAGCEIMPYRAEVHFIKDDKSESI